jgi:hypothetical protein
MKLIFKFGVAALLTAFLAVPALAEKHSGAGTTKRSEVKDSHDPYPPSSTTISPIPPAPGASPGESRASGTAVRPCPPKPKGEGKRFCP